MLQDFLANAGKRPQPRRLLEEPRESGYTKSFDGTDIYWEAHGPESKNSSERPMVFCYGLVCSFNQWRLQIARYSQNRPCLVFDYRGHHKSAQPQDLALMNMSAVAKDLAAVIHAQNYTEAVHIWGHSMGCNVALELALAEPELVRSLILCCGTHKNPFASMLHMDFLEKPLTPLLQHYAEYPAVYDAVWALMHLRPEISMAVVQVAGFNAKASEKRDVETYVRAVASTEAKTFFPLIKELSNGMPEGLLKKIQIPALVIAGARDLITPKERQHDLAKVLPKGEYIEIPAGSHNVQLDFGEYVCLKAEEFWKARALD